MKKAGIAMLLFSILCSSCALHNGLTSNTNNTTTEVVLSKNNFKVIGNAKGYSRVTYILGIGGLSKQGMINEAKAEMFENAGTEGASRAVINQTVELKHTAFPFVRTYEVFASGQVIEFTGN